MLYEQYEEGELNPARILNYFTDEEEHREAALFVSYKNPGAVHKRGTGEGFEGNGDQSEKSQHRGGRESAGSDRYQRSSETDGSQKRSAKTVSDADFRKIER